MDTELVKSNTAKTKSTNKKNLKKRIKISPITLVAVLVLVAVFCVFNFIMIPNLEKKYSNSYNTNSENVKVYEAENHFNLENTQKQISDRKAFVPEIIMPGTGETAKNIPLN